jgi:hypothetical protein
MVFNNVKIFLKSHLYFLLFLIHIGILWTNGSQELELNNLLPTDILNEIAVNVGDMSAQTMDQLMENSMDEDSYTCRTENKVTTYSLKDLKNNFAGIRKNPQKHVEFFLDNPLDKGVDPSGLYELVPYYRRINPPGEKRTNYSIHWSEINQEWQLIEKCIAIFPDFMIYPLSNFHFRILYFRLFLPIVSYLILIFHILCK